MGRERIASGTQTPANPVFHLYLQNGFLTKRFIFRGAMLAASLLLIVFLAGCAMNGSASAPPTSPQAAFSPSSLDFGDQDIGTTSNPLSIMLANTGGADLVVS